MSVAEEVCHCLVKDLFFRVIVMLRTFVVLRKIKLM